MIERVEIPEEVDGKKRLGRHVEHDPRSRNFAFGRMAAAADLKAVAHRTYGAILDQGNVGSCTGNAIAGARNCAPFHIPYKDKVLHEVNAISIYGLATRLDSIPGQFPPDDTGSSGLAAAKAAQQMGLITAYRHAFSIAEALAALQMFPVITGINWYEGFDTPDSRGHVEISGQVRGGHEVCVVGYEPAANVNDSLVKMKNSWGKAWGAGGYFFFTVATWARLLSEKGDATILI